MHPEVTRPDATDSDVTPADAGAQALLAPFSDPDAVARYAEGEPALCARLRGASPHDRYPAGGACPARRAGACAGGRRWSRIESGWQRAHPGWTFVGVDPAAEMLRLAERTLGPLGSRVQLLPSYIDDAPPGDRSTRPRAC